MRRLFLIVSTLLMMWFFYSWAANAQTPDQDDDVDNSTEVQVTEEDNGEDAEEDAEAEDEEEQGSSRFIPTEQISQDLGVSFPVDI